MIPRRWRHGANLCRRGTILSVVMLAGTPASLHPSPPTDAAVTHQNDRILAQSEHGASGTAIQNDRFAVVEIGDWRSLQKQLNDFTGRGYRIIFASGAHLLLDRGTDGNVDVEYMVFRPVRIERFQSDLNRAISQGYRLVPGTLFYDGPYPLGIGGVLEKASPRAASASVGEAPEAPRHEYGVIDGWSESRVSTLGRDGFQVVGTRQDLTRSFDSWESYDYVIFQKVVSNQTNAPGTGYRLARLTTSIETLERELNKYGNLGYRLGVVGGDDGADCCCCYFLEQPLNAPERREYLVLFVTATGDSTPERVLNDAASRGYQFVRDMWGVAKSRWFKNEMWHAVIMEKRPDATPSMEYVVMDAAALGNAVAAGTVRDFSVAGLIQRCCSRWGRLNGVDVVVQRPRTQ